MVVGVGWVALVRGGRVVGWDAVVESGNGRREWSSLGQSSEGADSGSSNGTWKEQVVCQVR